MGRDRRKTRLDKGGTTGGDFVGFSAFAAAPTTTLQASPVYTGSDAQLSLVFKRVTQKRDAVTKARALNELQLYFEQDSAKKEQVEALSHLVFIYYAKLHYDDSSAVRAAALSCLKAACQRLPKAWSTLVTEQQPQVEGMMWCAQADPAAEVRAAALSPEDTISAKGVINYVSRILGYDRPRSMHDALFARKAEPSSLSDSEREQLDERYERIVGTALSGMELWLKQHPETDDDRYEDNINDSVMWKTLTSSKSSLRRKTYLLLASLCQHAQSLVYGSVGMSALPKMLTTSLSQEREAINIPSLLEVFLLYLNGFPESPWDTVDVELVTKSLGKLVKKACYGASVRLWGPTMLPLLASFVDDSFSLQRQILSNLWKGREAALGPSDSLLIVAAVAECASFFLLRKETDAEPMETAAAKEFANTWLEALGEYLSMESLSSIAKAADISLLRTLSETFCKLDESSYNRPHCAIYGIRDWFWNEALPSPVLGAGGPEAEQRLARLLNSVIAHQQAADRRESHGYHVVRERFRATVAKYQEASSVPHVHAYDLMIASVQYCGAQYLFVSEEGVNATIEHFLVNDLLRWTVIHTSSLPARGQEGRLVTRDFTLLRECLLSIASPLKQKTLWESMLREIIAAECDLELLSTGLVVLLRETDNVDGCVVWADILRCETLATFAIKVGEDAISKHRGHFSRAFHDNVDDESIDDEPYNEDAEKSLKFLLVCVGLSAESSAVLVGPRVVHQWTEIAAPQEREQLFQLGGNTDLQNPLLDTLVSLIAKGGNLLTADDAERIILEAWRHGGRQWNEQVIPLLLSPVARMESSLCSFSNIVSSGANELRDLLKFMSHSSESDRSHVALVCHVWSERAFRVLRLCSEGITHNDHLPRPSIALVGLADLDAWKESISDDEVSSSHLYFCLTYLLQQYEKPSERLEVFMQSSESSSIVAVTILLALSDASNYDAVNSMARSDKRCAWFLSLLGGNKGIPNELLQSWCREAVRSLSADLKMPAPVNHSRITRGVSVLSVLIGTLFDRLVSAEGTAKLSTDMVIASDVNEGDNLWYVPDKENENARERVEVVRIHKDDFPRLYFTVRVEKSDGTQERQTVSERLRKAARPPDEEIELAVPRFTDSEKKQRSSFADLIFNELVKPVLIASPQEEERLSVEAASECLSVVISQCGLLGKAGIGSTRYEVFQLLSSLQSTVAATMTAASEGSQHALLPLRAFSLAMGLGKVVPASTCNFKLVKLKPDESLKAILLFYETMPEKDRISGFDRTVLGWLAISITEVDDKTLRTNVINLLYSVAAAVINEDGRKKTDKMNDCMLVMRAVQNAQRAQVQSKEEEDKNIDSEVSVLAGLIKEFSIDWKSPIDQDLLYQSLHAEKSIHDQLAVWHEPFLSLLTSSLELGNDLVATAARENVEDLVGNLFASDKRWFAFRLLATAATAGQTLRDDDDSIGDKTQRRLDKWENGLVEEEAEELSDDVALVSQWIPHSLMNEVESWEDDELQEEDEVTAFGRMLCWLSLLSFVDSAAVIDVRFRGSVSAYLDNMRTVNTVLSTALLYLDMAKDRNAKVITMEDALGDPSSLEISKLAALVLFRSVEVFPTHTKHWWEEDCPKALSSAVSQFVETKVAPETLRRELDRINNATDLGEMTVSGSVVSREVTATYMQDECQLSIVIQIPPTFPLRNVEVDGRKTLGIPEKRWKRWALQIRLMLNNQDGTLLDALMLWKQNVDKDFAGLEPCPVCYSILSVKTHELPNLECQTCNNCFHSSCLYKWFHSSGKSQCVLCQQPWSGVRIQKGT